MKDVALNKIQSIQRCVQRAREEYAADPDSFDTNFTRQDAAVLNVLRACEQSIDLAFLLADLLKAERNARARPLPAVAGL